MGFRGARRGTNFAGQEAGAEAARVSHACQHSTLCHFFQKALKLGMKNFQVKLKGTGPGRKV